jgi:hypothetical protein
MRSFYFAAALLSVPAFALAQGALTPPGAPAPTMKTLTQIEPRTPLQAGATGVTANTNGGFTISAPGSYYLSGNLTVASGDGIKIDTNNVTLDLNGFTLSSTSNPASDIAIFIPSIWANIIIRNGHIRGTGTIDNTTGEFSGAGFGYGIVGLGVHNVLISDITIRDVVLHAIYLVSGSTVERCAVTCCGYSGIRADVVTNSSAIFCANTAIEGTTVSNSQGSSVNGAGVSATTASASIGTSNSGIGLIVTQSAANCSGTTQSGPYGLRVASNDATPVLGSAENCNGTVASGTGIGLSAGTATNCHGTSASGSGIDAKSVANSYGKSAAGHGISATTVTGSTGESTDKDGVHCTVASDSFGYSYNMTGLSAATATNCYGASHVGYGLYAQEATNCHGKSDTGTRGLHADNTATGCTGEITTASGGGSSCGLWTIIATNCRGLLFSSTGSIQGYYGLSADIAQNCTGTSFGGNGLRATTSALNCSGATGRTDGIGLNASGGTANSCRGDGLGTGTALKAEIAIGCTSSHGVIDVPAGGKFLGTP